MSSEPIIRLEGVSKSFYSDGRDPVQVLCDTDLTIYPGDKASLVGPSGSGKSTLLSLMAGLLRTDSGTIEFDGVPIGDLADADMARLRAEQIGLALQSNNLIPFLSARENIELALGFGGHGNRRQARLRARELLERFGVAHRADHRPRQLSGGEAQRVTLAIAMANRPALLLADEVVGQLDGETAGNVMDEVLAQDFAVLYVTHDMVLADRVEHRYHLHDNRIEAR